MTTQKKRNKKNRRSSTKHPALDPQLNLKSRYEQIDYDYLDKLTEEEKMWLNSFTEEYVNANLKHKGKKLHKTKRLKKDCYDRNNARNRDILTKAKAGGMVVTLDELNEFNELYNNENVNEDVDKDEN